MHCLSWTTQHMSSSLSTRLLRQELLLAVARSTIRGRQAMLGGDDGAAGLKAWGGDCRVGVGATDCLWGACCGRGVGRGGGGRLPFSWLDQVLRRHNNPCPWRRLQHHGPYRSRGNAGVSVFWPLWGGPGIARPRSLEINPPTKARIMYPIQRHDARALLLAT